MLSLFLQLAFWYAFLRARGSLEFGRQALSHRYGGTTIFA